MSAVQRPKCLGILGWMFGHRYGSSIYSFERCKRCGLLVEQEGTVIPAQRTPVDEKVRS